MRDEVAALASLGGPKSKYDAIAEALGDEADEFRALVADRKVSTGAIGRALRARGFQVADGTIGDWRRRYDAR